MIKVTIVATIGVVLLAGSPLARAQATSGPSSSTPPAAPEMSAPDAQRAMISEGEVRATLENAGYTSIGDIKADEDGYSATATKDGKAVKIGVDHDGGIETLK